MLADYQDRASGGEGWLRILRFVPADNKVYVQTYSPWLNRFETDADSEFTLDFPMGGAFEAAGSVTVSSGSTRVGHALRARTQHAVRMAGDGHERRAARAGPGPCGGSRRERAVRSTSRRPPTTSRSPRPRMRRAAITLGANDPEGAALTYTIRERSGARDAERQRSVPDLPAGDELQRHGRVHVQSQRRPAEQRRSLRSRSPFSR